MPAELYEEIYNKDRQFSFGENWRSFLTEFNEFRLEEAKKSLVNLTGLQSLDKKRFVDIGCGSGLFSMAACMLGAEVISVDVDKNSVECCQTLKAKCQVPDARWRVLSGSALDDELIKSLPQADIVYSWGVLHHTGDMWKAIANVSKLCSKSSLLVLALYNKTEPAWIYKCWMLIKRIYNSSPDFLRRTMIHAYSLMFLILRFKGNFFKFRRYQRQYQEQRGMHYMHDVIDWLGGYPYEVASKQDMLTWAKQNDMELKNEILVSPTESGCNQFVFQRLN